MNIGDKVTITTILPLKDGGKFKRLQMEFKYWKTEQIGDVEVHTMNKMIIPPKTGIFMGITKKKLHRYYKLIPPSKKPTANLRRIFMDRHEDIEETFKDLYGKKRLDNKWKLDKVAIIATSRCRRYYVALSDLIGPEIKIV